MSLKKQTSTGLLWSYIEQFSGQIVNFTVNLVLARLLLPSDFGTLGLIFIFITIGNVLLDGGMTISLIKKETVSNTDYSSVFILNILLSLFIYLIIFLFAPYIAIFYNNLDLIMIIRVFSLLIVIQPFFMIQNVILQKEMKFKNRTLMKLPSIILSSIIAVILAYNGFGVWSLVALYLSQTFFWTLFSWIFSRWRPVFIFDKSIVKYHINIGYKYTIIDVINGLFSNIYQLVIGKFYNLNNVGFYTQALTLRQVPIANVFGSMNKVFLPMFSKLQGHKALFEKNYINNLYLIMLLITPIMLFISLFSESILYILYGNKWLEAAPYLSTLAVAGIFSVLCDYSLTVFKIKLKSSVFLKIELLNKLQTIFIIILIICINKSIIGLLLSIPFSAFVSFLLIHLCGFRYMQFNKRKLLMTLLGILLISIISIIPVVILVENKMLGTNVFIILVISGILFLSLYIALQYLFYPKIINTFVKYLKSSKQTK